MSSPSAASASLQDPQHVSRVLADLDTLPDTEIMPIVTKLLSRMTVSRPESHSDTSNVEDTASDGALNEAFQECREQVSPKAGGQSAANAKGPPTSNLSATNRERMVSDQKSNTSSPMTASESGADTSMEKSEGEEQLVDLVNELLDRTLSRRATLRRQATLNRNSEGQNGEELTENSISVSDSKVEDHVDYEAFNKLQTPSGVPIPAPGPMTIEPEGFGGNIANAEYLETNAILDTSQASPNVVQESVQVESLPAADHSRQTAQAQANKPPQLGSTAVRKLPQPGVSKPLPPLPSRQASEERAKAAASGNAQAPNIKEERAPPPLPTRPGSNDSQNQQPQPQPPPQTQHQTTESKESAAPRTALEAPKKQAARPDFLPSPMILKPQESYHRLAGSPAVSSVSPDTVMPPVAPSGSPVSVEQSTSSGESQRLTLGTNVSVPKRSSSSLSINVPDRGSSSMRATSQIIEEGDENIADVLENAQNQPPQNAMPPQPGVYDPNQMPATVQYVDTHGTVQQGVYDPSQTYAQDTTYQYDMSMASSVQYAPSTMTDQSQSSFALAPGQQMYVQYPTTQYPTMNSVTNVPGYYYVQQGGQTFMVATTPATLPYQAAETTYEVQQSYDGSQVFSQIQQSQQTIVQPDMQSQMMDTTQNTTYTVPQAQWNGNHPQQQPMTSQAPSISVSSAVETSSCYNASIARPPMPQSGASSPSSTNPRASFISAHSSLSHFSSYGHMNSDRPISTMSGSLSNLGQDWSVASGDNRVSVLTVPKSKTNANIAVSKASTMPSTKTLELYRKNAAKSKDPKTQVEFAKLLLREALKLPEKDQLRPSLIKEGFEIIRKLADENSVRLGHPDAQFFLAECYRKGALGVDMNMEKAFYLYSQASKRNHFAATYQRALCYELGQGTKPNAVKSLSLYRQAASGGITAAMCKLALIFQKGLLKRKVSMREALLWYKRAAADASPSNPYALFALFRLACHYEDSKILHDREYAFEMFLEAANMGHSPSMWKLGRCYEDGKGTQQEMNEARRWLDMAKANGMNEFIVQNTPIPV